MRSLIPLAAGLILVCCGPSATPTTSSATPASAPSTTIQPSPTSVVSITAQPSSSAVATVRPSPVPAATASPEDQRLARTIIDFARAPSTVTFNAIPFAEKVMLGLSDRIVAERASSDLVRPDTWSLPAAVFRGHVGPLSSLELLARATPTTVSVGPHEHCASAPMPPPAAVAGARRISIRPTGIDTCLLWWTVDLFVSPAGRIEAITLDLWEP